MKSISVKNAHIHNLKNIDIEIPKGKLVVFTGVSGSGKSSLVFNLIYTESVGRYYRAAGEYNHYFTGRYFDQIEGLNPAVAVEQNIIKQSNPRSSVGTRCEINVLLEYLFSQEGIGSCVKCHSEYIIGRKCPVCGYQPPKYTASSFSPNSGIGMCLHCYGRGRIPHITEKDIFAELYTSKESLMNKTFRNLKNDLVQYSKKRCFDINQPFNKQPFDVQRDYLYGSKQYYFKGYIPYILEVSADKREEELGRMVECPICGGSGINKEVLEYKILGYNIAELKNMPVWELYTLFQNKYSYFENNRQNVEMVAEILIKLRDLCDVGLHYLSLDRKIPTLSGGELQRLLLASAFHVGLDQLLYIFDEPTVGLHESEKIKLIQKLKDFTGQGNSVLVVEHDEAMLQNADLILEFGPKGGQQGGYLIFSGSYEEMLQSPVSIIGKSIIESRKKVVCKSGKTKSDWDKLRITNACTNNLKDVTVELPLGKLIGIAGVSGSGKSSLLLDTLVPLLKTYTANKGMQADLEEFTARLEGWEKIRKCIHTSQKPIGRTKTSIPASYIGIWDEIRTIFAKEACKQGKERDAGYFSFNGEGACPKCSGDGYVQLGRITTVCNACGGKRYHDEVLKIRYGGKTILDVLQMTMADAMEFFGDNVKIMNKLMMVKKVGLEYLTLGQPISTISGGEAQRLKLSKELGTIKNKDIMYVLDEPSTGLSYMESNKLITSLEELVHKGNTVVVIEHDVSFLANCDWIIEMGPGSDKEGGCVIAQGTPQELCNIEASVIAPYLSKAIAGYTV